MDKSKDSPYIIGIDLGTTNSALSYIDTRKGEGGEIEVFAIPQLVNEGTVKNLLTLPSFIYLPGEYELSQDAISLPWQKESSSITGDFARVQGARVPANLIFSAKSWLCHNRIDRTSRVLPWGQDSSNRKLSPVEASSYYLEHLKSAWNYEMAKNREHFLLENQQVVITIPASFDETARELTYEAAQMAGIKSFTMLEEPQAAFYYWIESKGGEWYGEISPGELILVFDMGGGTTDFNLITLTVDGEKEVFQRVAVGDHIMLGGDNADLALAREVEQRVMGPEKRLDYQQWLSLVQQCRTAKESLLGGADVTSFSFTILGKGRSVIGGSIKEEISASEIEKIILEGFFHKVELNEELKEDRHTGFRELGLPYVFDTSVLKHLSSFLKRHSINEELNQVDDVVSGQRFVRPDVLLFNGGVFKSPVIKKVVTDIVNEWFSDDDWSLKVLDNEKPDHAVAIGAAYYGQVLRGKGVRISGGLGRAYYIAFNKLSDDEELKGSDDSDFETICLLPKGTEEGHEIVLTEPEFHVLANNPVSFQLFSSSFRVGDSAGNIIKAPKDSFVELPPVKTVLHFGKKAGVSRIAVSLAISLNEFGTLDVWCASKNTPHRWKLSFQVRLDDHDFQSVKGMDGHTIEEGAVLEAIEILQKGILSPIKGASHITPENIMKKLSKALIPDKSQWPLSAIRKMWDSLITLNEKRALSPKHEARWINLCGFLLRPGFGYELDDWRLKELWKVFPKGLNFSKDGQCRAEWWIMWRRVAGGLTEANQEIVFKRISPFLLSGKKIKGAQKVSVSELTEIWMLAASLELLSARVKSELGEELIKVIKKERGSRVNQLFWSLSRIGARVPFHGPMDRVVPKESVEEWVRAIMKMEWQKPYDVLYAIAQICRKTDDRLIDISDSLKAEIVEKIRPFDSGEIFIKQINEVVSLDRDDEKKIFGDSLPVGLYV